MTTLSQSTPKQPASREALPLPWIDRLFARFEAYYGSRFADAWRGADVAMVKGVWAEKLAELTRDELAAGVQALDRCKFPPTLPEFYALCRPAPDYDTLHHEAVAQMRAREDGRDKWPSLALFWAAQRIGAWDLMSMSYPAMKTRWKAVFDKADMEARAGLLPDIPPRRDALPAPGKSIIPADEMKRRIADLKKSMGVGGVVAQALDGIGAKE